MELGRLREVPLREVWNHEALDLTPWLLTHADTLMDVLGIDLELSGSEHPVGSFAVDLVGRDQTHDCVLIVENQLTPTDHDHLGKLVTYAAGTDAKTVVWIAPTFRDEHRQALDLLNDLAGDRARFFGIELAVVAIGDSAPAPLLRLRAQPNGWHARVATAARAAAPSSARADLYQRFWVRCLEQVHQRHPGWTRNRRPGAANWLQLPSPFRGESYYAFTFVAQRRVRAELYLDAAGDPTRVADLYAALHHHRAEIEGDYGGPLNWEELPHRRASRIADYTDGDITDTASHDFLIAWFVDHGARLRTAIDRVSTRVLADIET
ncbi:DUF4268 domain-containing protein [Actinomycetospora sp. CA-101289]|uniref:DUF4268 domain-containing protein n=1 Tax=Actinomycetospora sp. CA-101289 TaxID=3239893 RepID=UPI003D95F79E